MLQNSQAPFLKLRKLCLRELGKRTKIKALLPEIWGNRDQNVKQTSLMTFKVFQNNIIQNTLLLTAVTERDMFFSAATYIPAHTTPTCWFLIACIGLPSHHSLNQPLSKCAAWEQSVLYSTWWLTTCRSFMGREMEYCTSLYGSLTGWAWVTMRPSSCQEEALESRGLLDLQTWITVLNQSGRHCARTSELRQPAPTPQLPWFPACSSQTVCARLPVGLNSGVKNERGESQL